MKFTYTVIMKIMQLWKWHSFRIFQNTYNCCRVIWKGWIVSTACDTRHEKWRSEICLATLGRSQHPPLIPHSPNSRLSYTIHSPVMTPLHCRLAVSLVGWAFSVIRRSSTGEAISVRFGTFFTSVWMWLRYKSLSICARGPCSQKKHLLWLKGL